MLKAAVSDHCVVPNKQSGPTLPCVQLTAFTEQITEKAATYDIAGNEFLLLLKSIRVIRMK